MRLYHEVHGQGEPLVLVAGFAADHMVWQPVINLFKEHYQVIVFDNRGSGQSDIPEGPYSISQMAEDAFNLMQQLNIESFNLIGNSMGGFIVQTMARMHPEKIKKLIITNSALTCQTVYNNYALAVLELLKANAPLGALIRASIAWAYSFQFQSNPEAVNTMIEAGVKYPYAMTLKGYEAQLAALSSFDSRDWIQKITIPSLVIGADEDIIFNENTIKKIAKALPNAQYASFKSCGHLPFIEYPEIFAEQVIAFLKK